MSFPSSLSFHTEFLPPSLHILLLSWRSSNTSPFSLELEALYQLAPPSEWEQLALLLAQLEYDFDELDAHIQHLFATKLQIFFSKANNEALRLRERMRKQLILAYDGHLVFHEQRAAFIQRRLQEPDVRDLKLGEEEKVEKILERLKPLEEVERPLTVEERRFCQGLGLFFPSHPQPEPSDEPSLSLPPPSTPTPPPSLTPELPPASFLRRRKPDASYSKLED